MARLNNEELFKILPLSIAQNRALTFGVYVYLPLNGRVILYKGSGNIVEDGAAIQRMVGRGLKNFYVLESERPAFEAWMKGTPFEKSHLELAAREAAAGEAAAPPQPPGRNPAAPAAQAEATQAETTQAEAAKASEEKPNERKTITPAEEKISAEEQAAREAEAKEAVEKTPAEELMAGLLKPDPENKAPLAEAADMAKKVLKASPEGSMIADIIENENNEHATTVAIYSMLFCMGLGKKEQQTLQDIVIASLLHDIGMTQVESKVVAIPKLKQQSDEKLAFDAHVKLGTELLLELDYVPNKRVLAMLGQHHEKFNGTGYPGHLESFRIDEMAQLVSMADLIDSIGRGHYNGTPCSLNDSLHLLAQIEKQTTFPEYFNPDVFKKVMTWLKKGGGQDYIAAAENAVNEAKQKMLKAG